MISLINVEDNRSWKENFAEIASVLGLDLRQYETRNEALEAIKERVPDILITDLHLAKGDSSGYEIARAGVEAGVQHVIIASETIDPSQIVEGSNLMTKEDVVHRLMTLVGQARK